MSPDKPKCTHCGLDCPDLSFSSDGKYFCCNGCRTVYELLQENGLKRFYELENMPGIQPGIARDTDKYRNLDDPAIKGPLLDFTDGQFSRVTFRIPAIHCVACVWLLENLFRLHPGIGRSQVNFPRREASFTYDEQKVALSELAGLLASLGYEPDLNLERIEPGSKVPPSRKLMLKLGVAGFAFGNIMLLSLPHYFGLDSLHGPAFSRFFGWISLVLSIPVLLYSASDYLHAAFVYIRRKVITVDFPIAIGIVALFSQSAWDIISGTGEGYLDSFAGLIFFLLCGRIFQQKTFEAMSFERDYRSYFPLSMVRLKDGKEKVVPLSNLEVEDQILVRHGELIPADSRLIEGTGLVDYSFVTGESAPVERSKGDLLFAGGRQTGGIVRLEILKPVSQSYLTSLWDDAAFDKEDTRSLHSMTNVFSRYFTMVVFFIAMTTTAWWLSHDPSRAASVFSAILIVACPCALALSAPFTLGTVIRLLGRQNVFIKNTMVIENLARVSMIVFDKTGTLTDRKRNKTTFSGQPLTREEAEQVYSLSRLSTHPLSGAIAASFEENNCAITHVELVREVSGLGVEGTVGDTTLLLGSRAWLEQNGVSAASGQGALPDGSVYLAVGGSFRGCFIIHPTYREGLAGQLERLASRFRLVLLSGDRDTERERLAPMFPDPALLHFQQSPFDKLNFIEDMQKQGEKVLMAGDGLNDAGALKQSDVGLALAEDITAFSPASDIIMDAGKFGQLADFLTFARRSTMVIWASFALSCLYNVIGISFAAAGKLSPVVSAILMPVSSVTVIAFAVGSTMLLARLNGILDRDTH